MITLEDFYTEEHRIINKYFFRHEEEYDALLVKALFQAAYALELQRKVWHGIEETTSEERGNRSYPTIIYPVPTSFLINRNMCSNSCNLILTLDSGDKIEQHFDHLPSAFQAETWAVGEVFNLYNEAEIDYNLSPKTPKKKEEVL